MKTKFLITGSNGFVGKSLCLDLMERGISFRAASREHCVFPAEIAKFASEIVAVGNINAKTDWSEAVLNCNVVIHLAGRVHVMQESSINPLFEFRRVNLAGTEALARCALENGVKRFVYVSSIKVNGEETKSEQGFSERDIPNPQNPYAVSKLEAEQLLQKISKETGLELVIVRLPLVYGKEVKGNFGELLKFVKKGIPLPLAAVKNKRDFIYIGNLVDALIACATHPNAAGKTYLLSDGEAISTPDLITRLADASGVPSRLFNVPIWMLKLVGKLLGKSAQIERLVSSLLIDSSKIRRELDWLPPYSLEEGLIETTKNL